jgi:hypothetical protein
LRKPSLLPPITKLIPTAAKMLLLPI